MAPSEPTGASGSPAGMPAPAHRGWARTGSGTDHRVQFYDDDAFLVATVAGYLGEGHAAGEAVVVFATPAHRDAIVERLRAGGLDLDRAAADGTLLLLDARATLDDVLRDGRPDPARFRAVIGARLARAPAGVRIRAFGEMVDLLWRDGNAAGAVALEGLWNELAAERELSMLCGYRLGDVDPTDAAETAWWGAVYRAHGEVAPSEAHLRLGDADARLRELSRLQQRAHALEEEVAQRKATERALRDAVHVRDEFLAAAGHELRTPLTAAQLYLQSLLAGLASPDIARIRRHAEKGLQQVERLARLVEDLLDVPRLTVGAVELDVADVELVELARDVVDGAAAAAARGGCALRLLGSAPLVGRWDARRLGQVIGALVTNAIKYGAGAPIEVTVRRAGGLAELAVRDHGPGVAPEDQARIFERYERAASDRHFSGLGLGLWIARRLVEAHGGTLTVSSARGEGATFVMRVPLAGP